MFSTMTNLLKVFNEHLLEFMDDIITIFPDNVDIKTGRTFVVSIKKVNPKKLIHVWKTCVNDVYMKEINEGNMNFFINKDYKDDLPEDTTNNVFKIIENLKKLIKSTSKENKEKSLKYGQNLCKICNLYYS